MDLRLNEPEQHERTTPADVLDQAFAVLRRMPRQAWLRGMGASLPLATLLICLYTLERVVGVRPALPLFAVLVALAYWARFQLLSRLARELVLLLAAAAPVRSQSVFSGLKTAMLAGLGSCAWAACLIVAGQRSFFGLLACLPLLSVRGAIAPSLLARAACAPEAGAAALSLAVADTRELRRVFVRVELFALLGVLVLFGNLYALLALSLLVASSVLGLDVGFVSALIEPDNELVLLLLLGLATLLLEPLQAAISAVAFQGARERREAVNLGAAIAALPKAPRASRARSQPTAAVRGVLLLCAGSLLVAPARAQDANAPLKRPVFAEGAAMSDELARQKAQAILTRSEFLPSPADTDRGPVQAWLDRRLRERERDLYEHDLSAPPRFELRLPPLLLMLVSWLLMLVVGAWVVRRLRHRRVDALAASARRASLAPPPSDQLAEAARWAHEGSYAQAVRALYGACLQALTRGRPANFGAAQTNGQLLQLAAAPLRAAFELLTLSFERCRYGRQELSQAEYEHAYSLTDQILRAAPTNPERQP